MKTSARIRGEKRKKLSLNTKLKKERRNMKK